MASDAESLRIININFSLDNVDEQAQSPLFATLPGEVRDRILALALTEYEDSTATYSRDTVYKRPGFSAPRRISVALLRTCKRVYREAWFRPWTQAEHVIFFTLDNRRPERATEVEELAAAAALIREVHGEQDISTEHVRVVAQMIALQEWRRVMVIPHLYPRRLTMTIRHTDWYYWEYDAALAIRGEWVSVYDLPASVCEVRVELESLERKSDQVDQVAVQMAAQWAFVRADGVLFYAEPLRPTPAPAAKDADPSGKVAAADDDSVFRWTGSSTWHDERWVRDEARPGELDYYVRTVTWRPSLERRQDGAERPAAANVVAKGKPIPYELSPFIDMAQARRLQVELNGLPGPEAARKFNEALEAEQAPPST